MTESVDFIVRRGDLRQLRFVPGRQGPDSTLGPGEVLLAVDRFAFTANNITYGAVGEVIGYWRFFPAAEEGWGRIPAWGFATVLRSRHEALAAGERIYGYLPMSTHLVVVPEQVTPAGFVDAASHRAGLPPIYNQYVRVAADPGYDRDHEPHLALFRPLFATAFLLDDWLAENDAFGARSVLFTSASSKTALGLAYLLRRRGDRLVVGLTSPAHADFVRRTGYYDRVTPYAEVSDLPREAGAVLVDFAGDGALLERIHRHFDPRLAYSCQVGVTHWEELRPPASLPGPSPTFFFAPDRLQKRAADWSAAELHRRIAAAMRGFLASASWLRVVDGRGPAAVEAVYRAMLEGHADPAEGHMLSLVARAG